MRFVTVTGLASWAKALAQHAMGMCKPSGKGLLRLRVGMHLLGGTLLRDGRTQSGAHGVGQGFFALGAGQNTTGSPGAQQANT
jgi:hypothetical protein